jgi:ribosomal-protein-alanine N-acetyltransferase
LDYGFSILNFEKVYSFTSIYNKKSEAVMKRIGMSKIGEFSHPKVPVNNELRLHVNYIIEKEGHLTS